ncbi:hypothetical protein EHC64_02180 [Vibrio parahaemolyticus]|uniref:hypothetical protein n=1 Tax=Vibrio parahaemolyticus TaxID=670 RepID=UPI00132EEB02|nr:hypothetical protein [Vibrio parahaemolyticus]QHG97996.1 hypothetical protein EHC64_02180 [Vibrio parahaemolyticus]
MSKVATELHGLQADESLAKKEIQSATDVAEMSRGAKLNRIEVSKCVSVLIGMQPVGFATSM